jgi:C-methyltransferase
MSDNAKAPPAQLARFVERVRHHLYRLHQRLVPAPVALSELVVGAWVAQAVHAAAELGIADALADGPLAIDELARGVEADPDALGQAVPLAYMTAAYSRPELVRLCRSRCCLTGDTLAIWTR